MSELTHVISSSGLEETSGAVSEVCPRELLGLACITDNYPCLCELVDAYESETVRNQDGETAVVRLTLGIKPGVGEPQKVMSSLELTGYKADIQISRHEVVATFNLRRPQNTELRSFIRNEDV